VKKVRPIKGENKMVDDLGEVGCVICQYCYEEDNKLICEKWEKIVDDSDYCDSFVARP
jgi:hypothetical protein